MSCNSVKQVSDVIGIRCEEGFAGGPQPSIPTSLYVGGGQPSTSPTETPAANDDQRQRPVSTSVDATSRPRLPRRARRRPQANWSTRSAAPTHARSSATTLQIGKRMSTRSHTAHSLPVGTAHASVINASREPRRSSFWRDIEVCNRAPVRTFAPWR